MNLKKTLSASLLGALIVITMQTQASASKLVVIDTVSVLVQQAVESALIEVPGLVVVTELVSGSNGPLWEVEILDIDKELKLVEIDAMTGSVVRVELSDS